MYTKSRKTRKILQNIRQDHIARYELAANIIKEFFPDKNINGLDIFCGNGYGSYIVAKALNNLQKITSVDGSKETINFAKKNYGSKKIKYKHKLFPFKLNKNFYDFIISLESVEHVKDDKVFIETLVNALKPNGIFILSTPNEEKQSLKLNPNRFHYRHYITKEMVKQLETFNLRLVALYGQNVYKMDADGKYSGILSQNEMGLEKDSDGQFCVYILQKNA